MKIIELIENALEKVETGVLDANGISVCLGDCVKKKWGSSFFNAKRTDVYRIHKIVYHEKEGRFLLGNPNLESADYNIWENNSLEVVDSKYEYLCNKDIDNNFNKLGPDDLAKGIWERVRKRIEQL